MVPRPQAVCIYCILPSNTNFSAPLSLAITSSFHFLLPPSPAVKMAPPVTVLVYARTHTPLLRLPLLITDIIALPLCIISGNIPGITFVCLSIIFAAIVTLEWFRCRRSHSSQHPDNENQIFVSKLCMLVDAILSVGFFITWIISLIQELSGSGYYYYNQPGIIACFTLFLAWLVRNPVIISVSLGATTDIHTGFPIQPLSLSRCTSGHGRRRKSSSANTAATIPKAFSTSMPEQVLTVIPE
jgi:hypothetical protein